ncbi:flagellar basal body-associated FliL family protein [Sphingomonas soli]|uniref:flagellar basal body-associated FliL family protein n=1 Tax=Sphingomonas soli TaxID=266127 RepID=UPI000832718A|nr:flagellar basal body-associated FliL family protein [Sphingomonas soli]
METLNDDTNPAPKKKKKGKLLLFVVAPLLLAGGGGGAAYAMGWLNMAGGSAGAAAKSNEPQLLPKSEQKRAGESGEAGGKATPQGEGGDKYASSYYALEKEFTSNLQDSVHFIQVGVAVSTPYDGKVIENVKTHEIAIRSAILMALGETTEDEVFTAAGKKSMQDRLTKSINAILKEKEGFGGIGNVYFTNFIVQ